MKIKYLGTAALECIPAPFCNCDLCEYVRKHGGKDIRTTAQAVIDDFLLMDLGPDTASHFLKYNLDTEKVDTCLVTHSHFDHFVPGFFYGAIWVKRSSKPFDIYMPSSAMSLLKREISEWFGEGNIEKRIKYQEFKPFDEITIKDNYIVHSYKAHHDPRSTPLIYSVKNIKENKQMLYAHDTGLLKQESLDELKKVGGYYNLISLDCTNPLQHFDMNYGHLTGETIYMFLNSLKDMKLIDENTLIVLSHFTHNCEATHKELVKKYKKDKFIIAYDGLEVEF